LSQRSIAIALVLLGLGLSAGMSTAAASRDRVAPAGPTEPTDPNPRRCGAGTFINGVTQNKTDMPILVTQTGQGLTNEWCREPGGDIRANASDGWRAGDDTGNTDVNIVYLLANGDRVLVFARITKGGDTDVGCRFVEVANPPRRFDCEAEIVAATPELAFVRFTLRPIRF
jgi:hypothetical protein